MYKFTLKKQEIDNRDYLSKTSKLNITKSLVELKMPTIYDQKNLGSCVSNAIALCVNYYVYNQNENQRNDQVIYA